MLKNFAATGAVAFVALASTAMAQDTSAPAIYETVDLRAGFTPDPYNISVRSGGVNNARDLGGSCRGYIATSPDVRVFYESGSFPLIFSGTADADTTLVINGPDGRWYCDDDGGPGLNPEVRLDNPMSGRYEVWLGTYSSSETHPAVISISEIGGTGDNFTAVQEPVATGPDVNAEPIYETVTLRSGFTPDPYIVRLMSGGANDARDLGGECRGTIASAPDVRLNYSSGTLPLYISVDSMSDTTLVINAPNGQWYCNDDGGDGLNPSVRFEQPLAGRYEIWVGSYGGGNESAELNISELYSE